MKQYLFIVLLILPCLLFAQTNTWFSNDQQWYYHYGSMSIVGFEELNITGEVPINSYNCIEVETRRRIQNVEFPDYDINPDGGTLENHYIYEQNDSVFYYNSDDDAFELMYDFNMQLGDQMTIFSSGDDVGLYGDSIVLEIDSLGVMDIDGSPLRFQRANLLIFQNGYDEVFEQTFIFEKLGVVNLTENYHASHLILKKALISYGLFETSWSFRCYSDSDISYQPLGNWCDKLPLGNWLVPDASWCYYKSFGVPGFSEKNIKLVEQVIFPENNPPILWKANQEIRSTSMGLNSAYTQTIYFYERDGKLFQVSEDLTSTKMLYDLNWTVGDTIPLPLASSSCDESYFVIDSVGQIVLDDVPLRKLYCTATLYDAVNSIDYGYSFDITSRLGSFDLDFAVFLDCIVDINTYNLTDYSDNQINVDPDDCFTIIVSNHELFNNGNISISPNPSSDFIHIESDVEIQQIEIMDASGKLIQLIQNNFETLDIHHLAKGIYFLNITTQKGNRVVEKISIQ